MNTCLPLSGTRNNSNFHRFFDPSKNMYKNFLSILIQPFYSSLNCYFLSTLSNQNCQLVILLIDLTQGNMLHCCRFIKEYLDQCLILQVHIIYLFKLKLAIYCCTKLDKRQVCAIKQFRIIDISIHVDIFHNFEEKKH